MTAKRRRTPADVRCTGRAPRRLVRAQPAAGAARRVAAAPPRRLTDAPVDQTRGPAGPRPAPGRLLLRRVASRLLLLVGSLPPRWPRGGYALFAVAASIAAIVLSFV